ncbi:microtubule-associated protein, MAP65/Ase1/PRC1 [Artemisia annua]|uniref:Microtubule-associated protein, MAP65/Ase1/PRC1 n=1 Tax=Artemisia annua TaxID=35608 RepID=A0A2U1MGM9_ARTAN|nr:microtubule-associated protein, MAP65/Ase1/PRC1 [Artemisia annua]
MLGAATTFNALLQELQQIWIDIGETEAEKDRMLIELEIECLEVYRRKVDEAANAKACLHQSVAAKEAELATLLASLGDLTIHSAINVEKKASSLKGQLMIVTPLVEDLKLKKEERIKQFADIKGQVEIINGEILGYSQITKTVNLEEQDLSARKLSEYQSHLRSLQKEKSQRISKVLAYVNEVHLLCSILGLDFGKTVSAVHPSLHDTSLERATNISDITLEGLENAILKLKTERKVRFQKLKDIVTSLYDLWNIMDTTREEKRNFSRITSVIRLTEAEMVEPGALSTETIQQATQEVERLNKLKASRMKELVMKRRAELEEICFKMHMEPDPNTAIDKSNAMIDSGLVDPGELLANIEAQISKVSKEALSRKEIMDRIDRWLSACEEENWLEDYNLDSTRFSGGRSAHINLKRAERARITIKKIPAIVDNLICKTVTWEDDKKQPFLYDGARLVKILEEYKLSRLQKEEEKKLLKDQKKIRNLLLNEKESMYGSKPSPRRSSSFRKSTNTTMTPTPRRNSLTSPTPDLMTPRSYSGRHNGYFKEFRKLSTGPLNFVSIPKEDTISYSSIFSSEPESPPQS